MSKYLIKAMSKNFTRNIYNLDYYRSLKKLKESNTFRKNELWFIEEDLYVAENISKIIEEIIKEGVDETNNKKINKCKKNIKQTLKGKDYDDFEVLDKIYEYFYDDRIKKLNSLIIKNTKKLSIKNEQ